MYKFKFTLPALVALFLIFGCGQKAHREMNVYDGYAQGTTFHIVYDQSAGILEKEMDTIFKTIDHSMSLYDSSSIICQFNQSANGIETDLHFKKVFEASRDVYNKTDGAFDPTVFPLVKYWGFGPQRFHPDSIKNKSGKLDSLLKLVNFKDLVYKNSPSDSANEKGGFLYKSNKNIQLDFNGIAQGYTVDLVCELFDSKGVQNYMVEIGGEVRAKGKNGEFQTWRIGIDKPTETEGKRELQAIVSLDNLALATSGSYRKFYMKDGKRYSHTIDPKTGYPVDHNLLSVSVFAKTCTQADALATAFMASGSHKTVDFIKKNPDVQVYMISSGADNNYIIYMSPGLEKMIEENK